MAKGLFNSLVEGAFGESVMEPITERGDGIEVAEVFVLETWGEGVHVGTEGSVARKHLGQESPVFYPYAPKPNTDSMNCT